MQDNTALIVYNQIHSAMREADAQRFTELLRACPLEVWDLMDIKGCSCTLHTVFHNLSSCFFREDKLKEFSKIAVDFCFEKYSSQAPDTLKRTLRIREYQSSKTALMFAVQSNQKAKTTQAYTKLLIEHGADPNEVDLEGHGAVHFAAMLDYAALLVFLYKELKISVVKPDIKGRMPLHLAALDGSYHTSDLLIAWNSPIDLQDNQGNTPLHLASFGGQSSNYRIVRHLLLRGAQRQIVNKAGKTAVAIAYENSNKDIAEALVSSSQIEPSCLAICNPCSTTLTKPKYKLKAYVLFHLIQFFRNGVMAFFVLPGLI